MVDMVPVRKPTKKVDIVPFFTSITIVDLGLVSMTIKKSTPMFVLNANKKDTHISGLPANKNVHLGLVCPPTTMYI